MPPVGEPSPSRPAAPRVLLAGDIGMRLEVDFVAVGIACTVAPSAAAAVAWMRASRFDNVVVPPHLPDMVGTAFALGLVQHFPEVIVLLYGAEVDGEDLAHFARQGRVVTFPPHADGLALADYVVRRAHGGAPTSPAADLPPLATTHTGAATPLAHIAQMAQLPIAASRDASHAGPRPVTMMVDAANHQAQQNLLSIAQETAELQTRVAALTKELEEERRARQNVEASAQAELDEQLERERRGRGEEATALRAEVEKERKARADLNRELFDARNRLKVRERERDEMAAERDQLRIDYQSAKAALDDKIERERALTAERDELQGLLASRMSVAHDQKRASEEARAELERTRADLAEVQKAAAAAEQGRSRVAQEAATLKRELEEATGALSSAQARVDELERTSDRDQGKLEALVDERDALRVETRGLQQTAAALGAKLEAAQAEIARLQSTLDAARAEHKAALDAAHAEHKAALDAARAEHKAAAEEIELRRRMAADEQRAWNDEKRGLAAQIEDAERRATEAERRAVAAREEHGAEALEKKVLEGAVAAAEQERDLARAEHAEANAKLEVALQEAAHKEVEKRKIAAELVALRVKGERMTEQKLTAEREGNRALVEGLSGELAAAKAETARMQIALERAEAAASGSGGFAGGSGDGSGGGDASELQLLEARLDAVMRERDRALMALTEASRKLMELEDERMQPVRGR